MTLAVTLFLASTAFVAYVLAGYPILLAAFARIKAKPIQKRFEPRAVTIIVPVRNGARFIGAKLASLLASDYPTQLLDVLVVSDGSADETNTIVEQYPDQRVSLLSLAPGGKATAVSRALEQATGEIIVLTDVRQTFDPSALKLLVACFGEKEVGVVTGELVIREGVSLEEYNTGLYWRYEKWIRRNLNKIDCMLGATGSIYAIRREFRAPIPSDILLDDVYLPFVAAFRGTRIYFEDDAKAYDLPTSLHSEFWRKVRTQAGVYQIMMNFPRLLWPGNRRFLHFFSHKFGRLLLPFALICAAVSSFGMPSPWREWILIAQAGFYGLALLDLFLPDKNPLRRGTAVIRTFVVLVAAALCAVTVFFVPSRRLWKETRVGKAREAAESDNLA
jgi:biofilm PGA synthesis N-glycosyltransferase PgaC